MYTPPFKITSRIVNLIAGISAKIERYAMMLEADASLRLRKANRIKTIHSSLAIEGNNLSEVQVQDIIDGKNVVAPLREIQEVKNAIATYELFTELNPYSISDLLRAHGVMMSALIDNPGRWRKGGVGVFGETGCVHLAPSAERVHMLMADLFDWLKKSDDHLLIRSCVFHYELEFIHPFIDGNGRMGRLWQSLILSRLHPLFGHLPVENMVYSNQQAYYDAITSSNALGESTPFIEFMLGEILSALERNQSLDEATAEDNKNKLQDKLQDKLPDLFSRQFKNQYPEIAEVVWHLGSLLHSEPTISAHRAGELLGLKERMVRIHIATLRNLGLVERIGSNKTGYWKIRIPE